MSKIPVAILGATGMVGQRFIDLLKGHPGMEIVAVVASEKRAGKRYTEAVNWLLEGDIPDPVGRLRITSASSGLEDLGAKVLFSALPPEVAAEVEARLSREGGAVFSNVKVNRMRDDVPILVPEVNPEHLALVDVQRKRDMEAGGDGKGFIITNANCATTGLVLGLAPLLGFGLKKVFVSTYQALSGAGYPGVSSMDSINNVIPFIKDEEQKMVSETAKILGRLHGGQVIPHPTKVYPSCARVAVRDGHLEKIWVELEDLDIVKVADSMMGFKGLPQRLHLSSAPDAPIIMHTRENRPQPGLDVMAGSPSRARGMAISVGRLRTHENMMGFTLLVHNTIRGASGGSILNAELAISEGLIK